MYIQITLRSNKSVSHNDRRAYLRSLYGSVYQKKKGMIFKFNGSIGFKSVVDDIYTDYPTVHTAPVETPTSYVSPEQLLYRSMWVDLSKNGIVKFVIPIGKEVHPVSQYTYDREDICKRFVKFLQKVYPKVSIEVKRLDSFRYTVKTFVLNHFYQSMDFNDNIYTVECSAHRMLTDKELSTIYKDMDGCCSYKWHIEQYYCETCKGYNAKSPYHIEVVYD